MQFSYHDVDLVERARADSVEIEVLVADEGAVVVADVALVGLGDDLLALVAELHQVYAHDVGVGRAQALEVLAELQVGHLVAARDARVGRDALLFEENGHASADLHEGQAGLLEDHDLLALAEIRDEPLIICINVYSNTFHVILIS